MHVKVNSVKIDMLKGYGMGNSEVLLSLYLRYKSSGNIMHTHKVQRLYSAKTINSCTTK